ncbi:MAG: type II toxin-antitoxin system prevent-host-death family antitoxin [Candidatus Binatia bacterium]
MPCRSVSPSATMPRMGRIGVRQLQQNAATAVERVRLGESIEVTVRGRPVAKLVPVTGTLLDPLEASGEPKRGRGDAFDLGPPLKPRRGVELPSRLLWRGCGRTNADALPGFVRPVEARHCREGIGAHSCAASASRRAGFVRVGTHREVLRARSAAQGRSREEPRACSKPCNSSNSAMRYSTPPACWTR